MPLKPFHKQNSSISSTNAPRDLEVWLSGGKLHPDSLIRWDRLPRDLISVEWVINWLVPRHYPKELAAKDRNSKKHTCQASLWSQKQGPGRHTQDNFQCKITSYCVLLTLKEYTWSTVDSSINSLTGNIRVLWCTSGVKVKAPSSLRNAGFEMRSPTGTCRARACCSHPLSVFLFSLAENMIHPDWTHQINPGGGWAGVSATSSRRADEMLQFTTSETRALGWLCVCVKANAKQWSSFLLRSVFSLF